LIKSELVTDPKTHVASREYDIMCIGDAPRLKDWKFMCQLEFTPKGNIFNLTYNPDSKDAKIIPERFRTTPFTLCEDCGVKRYRTTVFVLHNEKEDKWMQVGSTCLGSFLGVDEKDVHTLADFATTLASMPDFFKKTIAKTANSDKNNKYSGTNLKDLVTYSFASVRNRYESYIENANKAEVWFQTFTHSSHIVSAFNLFRVYPKNFWEREVTDVDKQKAEKMIEYFKAFSLSNSVRKTESDNITIVMGNEVVARRHFKYIRLAMYRYMYKFGNEMFPSVKKYRQVLDTEVKPFVNPVPQVNNVTVVKMPQTVKKDDGHFGKVGDTLSNANLALTVKEGKMLFGKFGKFCMAICSDVDGREIIFSSSKAVYKKGEKLVVKSAVVNKHSVYKNVKQTFLNNVKF